MPRQPQPCLILTVTAETKTDRKVFEIARISSMDYPNSETTIYSEHTVIDCDRPRRALSS